MKSASAVLGAATTPPAPTGKGNANGEGSASGKPAFDELLHKHTRASANAGNQHANASAAKKQDGTPAESADKTSSSHPRKPMPAEDWTVPAPGAWGIPATLEPAGVAMALDAEAAAAGAVPARADLLSGTAATPDSVLPASQRPLMCAAMPAASLASDPLAVATTLPSAAAGNDAVAQPTTAAATPAESSQTPSPAPADARPAPQNPPSFVQHLAAGAAATALPEALGLVNDAIDTLRRDIDAEPATPTLNALASASPVSSNGLARTATVNPLEAPPPDLHSEHFDEAIGTRLSWMADQKIGQAHIKVSPGEMGMIEVRLRMDGDRIHADFSSAQPEVRQALEASLPRLREMLDQQGFQLAQADVGHRRDPSQASAQNGGHSDGSDSDPVGTGNEAQLPRPVIVHARGLLDAYA